MNELQLILQAFERSQQARERAVLATVVQTNGSVYRRPGARMLLTEGGQMISAISGGCLEADILERSRLLLADGGDPSLVRYDTTSSDDIVFGFGMGCNGIIDVLIEPLDQSAAVSQLCCIQECLSTQQTVAIATVFSVEDVPGVKVGDRLMMKSDTKVINHIANPDIAQRIAADAYKSLVEKQTRVQSYALSSGKINVLLEIIRPPQPLLIFGAGYDAIPLVQFAKHLGWHVTVIDHRPEHLTHERFPLADQLLFCTPDPPHGYRHLLTPQTVAVVMTHRYISDLAFLKTLMLSRLLYLGVLGPKRRMQQLWQDLAEHNITPTPEQNQQLYNPVGLDIGAETPEEIALSIVAEIQAVLSGRSGCFLRDRTDSIHASSQITCLELAS
ncbi:XdhC/CoxI family protein [Pseudanabaena sp. FACHB-2040]|uniref:XdhC family protein n=1 Tax=Pseudanabaena sp. FACHB-2040 TaxID=2692859 RepID=UPI001683EFEA|nr:XdhC/CoxI family protein [Pseudanabaena sp. FACHB-2040]MBD2261172.1 XdhC family protein [Pseudanabaena sp. FACHB-2040]